MRVFFKGIILVYNFGRLPNCMTKTSTNQSCKVDVFQIYGSFVTKLQVGQILKNLFFFHQTICLLQNGDILCKIDY